MVLLLPYRVRRIAVHFKISVAHQFQRVFVFLVCRGHTVSREPSVRLDRLVADARYLTNVAAIEMVDGGARALFITPM